MAAHMLAEAFFLGIHSSANWTFEPFLSITHHSNRLKFHRKVQRRQILQRTIFHFDCIGSARAFVKLHSASSVKLHIAECTSEWMQFGLIDRFARNRIAEWIHFHAKAMLSGIHFTTCGYVSCNDTSGYHRFKLVHVFANISKFGKHLFGAISNYFVKI
ncbi:unnamed protein product [Albugo candida]|uniref:Uncharacterized protein n=1 Tax=Albugo candida TaxID=65357 RepID=A0A024GL44_9STRA|nr:unnamed protein product [Albugo candida]|eukprot:CCI47473.1 unnamed protein product [Albugo candida]